MSRIGAIVRRLYGDEVKPAASKVVKQGGRLRRKLEDLNDALSRRPTLLWVVRIVVLLLAAFVVIEGIFQYNRLQAWNTTVLARRADVDRELKRRANLIPNVIYLARRYESYEQEMVKYVSDARAVLQKIQKSNEPGNPVNNMLEKALSKLVALAEAYPDLKATQPIQDLMKNWAETENRIADVKKEYNAASEQFNQYMTTFPGNVFALIYRFKLAEYVSTEENLDVPQLNLDVLEQKPPDLEANVDSETVVDTNNLK
ncbi:LemA family protein [Planctomycetota bacterium]